MESRSAKNKTKLTLTMKKAPNSKHSQFTFTLIRRGLKSSIGRANETNSFGNFERYSEKNVFHPRCLDHQFQMHC